MKVPRAAVIVFPGSTCEVDTYYVLNELAHIQSELVWHEDFDPAKYEIVFLPGGFTYADYLRAGAIASLSPAVDKLREKNGEIVIVGICNGFQILTEAGFLPGALTVNIGMRFVCKRVRVRIENNETPFTNLFERGDEVNLWVAHREGRYILDEENLRKIEERGRVVLRYVGENPNGSLNAIAGITDEKGLIVGLMPHPERTPEDILGDSKGLLFFRSLLNWFK